MTRRELLRRAGRSAVAAGALPLAGRIAAGAWAEPLDGSLAQLARTLTGRVVTPADAGYDQARVLYNTRFDTVHPRGVVFCASRLDVERTVAWARKHAVPVAPRSGGHSYGGYSTSPGIILDVSPLAHVSLDAKGRATVGAGARLIDVYAALWLHGRTIPGGSCPTVGIAGLTQGGGIGFAARKLGLTCDSLLEATVVTAAGKTVVCNATNHADLYWALRGGGGGNFGVVTRFVFETHPVGNVTTFKLDWPWADARRVVQAWQRLAPHAPDGLFSVCNLSAVGGGSPSVTAAGQFFGGAARLRAILQPLASTGSPTRFDVVERSYMSAVEMWAGCTGTVGDCHLAPQGSLGRSTFKGKSDIANTPLSVRGIDNLVARIEARAHGGPGSGIALLDSWGGAIARVPKAATAFVHRDALFSFQYLAYWGSAQPASVAAANIAWLRSLRASMRPYVSGFAYQNYIDPDMSNWKHAYYGANYARLVAVKRKYDPHGLFRFRQGIPARP
jgi:FAD/FMN-containing dehydrogenase